MRSLRVAMGAVSVASALLLSGCGGGASTPGVAAGGPPQQGGEVVFTTSMEPRTLDPGVLGNVLATQSVVGNALYGQLFTSDEAALAIEPKMAESLESLDGVSWTLTLRAGLQFSDGTPLEADDVKFAWDRMKDPALGAIDTGFAATVARTEVVSPTELAFELVSPNMQFGQSIAASALNWVGKPEAIRSGPAEFDRNPIGAGPFVLEKWTRNGDMVLVRNEKYYDAPKPYLDKLTVRALIDTAQRMSTLLSGGSQLTVNDSSAESARAIDTGLVVHGSKTSGGNVLVLNNAAAPFDDIRARRAVAAGIDYAALGMVLNGEYGEPVNTLFTADSPFYDESKKLPAYDPAEAQRLLNELAADGKPLKFTIMSYSSTVSKRGAEAMQSQLSALDNIEVGVDVQDTAAVTARSVKGDFQASISGLMFSDPEPSLYRRYHSSSATGNIVEVVDPELDAALEAGRAATEVPARKAAYGKVQDRLISLVPQIFYTRNTANVLAAPAIGGVHIYGQGGIALDDLWLQRDDAA
ncbi:ABC transporter substrate-binding protein [Nocardia jinanensis]|uniref:Peptide ABC transporter n=1 Tax=Nocardia jinanensis TaxID=382504 RepID=A0A917RLG3_9NOCA|nr:ABC transporter substrate-binding protein [Nocardia jinanensis]GGL12601.1 peptide ABC transporter [Nocardia jinanensis]